MARVRQNGEPSLINSISVISPSSRARLSHKAPVDRPSHPLGGYLPCSSCFTKLHQPLYRETITCVHQPLYKETITCVHQPLYRESITCVLAQAMQAENARLRSDLASARAKVRDPRPYTPYPTPYTLHPTPYALHPTPYTLHPYALQPTPVPHTTDARLHVHECQGTSTLKIILQPKPSTPTPKPQILNSDPHSINHAPSTLNAQPATLRPESQTINYKPKRLRSARRRGRATSPNCALKGDDPNRTLNLEP